MLSLPLVTWLRFVVWLAVGLVVYFMYGAHNSVLQRRLNGLPAGNPAEDNVPTPGSVG
jgi:APA family basic amino acid/polyamine antiporter